MQKGFSLFEILVVIGIIGAFSLAIIPAFRVFQPTLQLSGITRELASDIRYIQQITVTEQQEHCILFFIEDKKYQLKKCDGEIIKEKNFPAEIKSVSVIGLTDNKVKYNPYGSVKESGTIILENTKNETKTILIKASGFVSIIN